jgi:hypothetical protein
MRLMIRSGEVEREVLWTHSVPRFALLGVRHSCVNPLALLPLALADACWPTGPRAGRPSALRRARVPLFSASRLREANRLRLFAERDHRGFHPLVPKAEVVAPV